MYRFLIIGAGISGLTIARLLQMSGENSFIIFEAEKVPGGLCRSQVVGSHTLDLGGGHFLCSKYPEVYQFIFSHLPKTEFNFFNRISKIKLSDSLSVDYPLELNLWQIPSEEHSAYLDSLLQSGESKSLPEPLDFESWIKWKFGEKISDTYMLPYNKKIWGIGLSELDTDWLGKIPRVSPLSVLESFNKQKYSTEHFPSHAQFYYPKSGGFQRIIDSIYAPLKKHVALSEPIFSIERQGPNWLINKQYQAQTVINTAPWSNLFHALGSPSSLEQDFQKLRSNSIMISLWERDYSHQWHWRYLPDLDTEAHREFFVANYALGSKSKGVVTETEIKRWPGTDTPWRNGEKPLFESIVPLAYPIPVRGRERAIQNILNHYRAQGLFGLGRWGQWQYFNSDVCIWEAMKLFHTLKST